MHLPWAQTASQPYFKPEILVMWSVFTTFHSLSLLAQAWHSAAYCLNTRAPFQGTIHCVHLITHQTVFQYTTARSLSQAQQNTKTTTPIPFSPSLSLPLYIRSHNSLRLSHRGCCDSSQKHGYTGISLIYGCFAWNCSVIFWCWCILLAPLSIIHRAQECWDNWIEWMSEQPTE